MELQNIIIKSSIKGDDRFLNIHLTNYGTTLFRSILLDLTCYTEKLNLDKDPDNIQHILDSLLKLNWHILKYKTQDV